jgi:hypothetical protein
MEFLHALEGLHPLMRVVLIVGIPLLFLVVASNPGLVQNIVHILQAIPPIIYTPIYLTAKKPEAQTAAATTGQTEEPQA